MHQIHFTIITVLYHSKKWISNFVQSLANGDYNPKHIDLILLDNAKSSGDSEILDAAKVELDRLNRTVYVRNDRNLGFGRANNLGSEKAETEILFFLNIDTELAPDCLTKLAESIQSSDGGIGLWECRQFPYEHPKYYDPVTMECSWSSGACMAVLKEAFTAVGGFDPHIHMYCEDVELSWKFRLNGYRLRYVPKAVVHHFAYQYPGESKPIQLYQSLKNAIYLRFRYGKTIDILKGGLLLFTGFFRKSYSKWSILRIICHCPLFWAYSLKFRWKHREKLKKQRFEFHGTDFSLHRKGAFYDHEKGCPNGPLVSVIIRTVDRPDALREAMASVIHQTYEDVEIIVVQDGPEDETTRTVIESFDSRRVKYLPTGRKVGRCRAGNIGLENASGEYINFLDDDDLFFADHLEVLVGAISRAGADSACALSFVTPQIIFQKPYNYKIVEILHGIDVPYNPYSLLYFNQFPIQGVLFSRHLYEKHGGFDEELAYLEDWDLWLRYSQSWKLARVDKTTSLFRVPGNIKEAQKRSERLEAYHETLYRKYYDHTFRVSGRDLIEMSSQLFNTFPVKLMRHEIDNMDASLGRHCLYLPGGDPIFHNSLKSVVMKLFQKISRKGKQ